MTPEQEYQQLYERMYHLCQENGWGDPFSYARSREIHLAGLLGHKIADSYSGADAIDEDGGAEYKSTIGDKINASSAPFSTSIENLLPNAIVKEKIMADQYIAGTIF